MVLWLVQEIWAIKVVTSTAGHPVLFVFLAATSVICRVPIHPSKDQSPLRCYYCRQEIVPRIRFFAGCWQSHYNSHPHPPFRCPLPLLRSPTPVNDHGRYYAIVHAPHETGLLSLSDESNISAHCRDVLKVSTVFLTSLWVTPLLLFSSQILAWKRESRSVNLLCNPVHSVLV